MTNPFKDVIARLEKQKSSIEKALAALREVHDASGELESYATRSTLPQRTKGKRKISAEGRRRMAEAQQRRWAVKRALEFTATKKTISKSVVKKSATKKAATKTE